MTLLPARLLEILQMGGSVVGIFDLIEGSLPAPGQYLPAQNHQDETEILTRSLFRTLGPDGRVTLGPIPPRWGPGDRISCLPPQGNGFKLPPTARRVGLLSLEGDPIQILPLIQPALAQNAAVALFFQEKPHPNILEVIPASVEINPLSLLLENLAWLDFLAVEAGRENLKNLSLLLGEETPGFEGQVLVKMPMPCRGLGECGACAVKTRHGWRQACTDGPVFPLKELLHVVG